MTKKSKNKIITIMLVIIFTFSICVIPAQAESLKVIIGGEPFGLKLYCKGVMVLKLEKFKSGTEYVCPAETSDIRVNDIITKTDDVEVKSNNQFSRIIKSSKGRTLKLEVLRDNKVISKTLTPKKNSGGVYYSGMWIRDSCAGLGTITYYDTHNAAYGALGHGICDIDTGGLMPSESGEIISASITSVSKSENNNIGTLNGYFTDTEIGSISKNTPLGIFGKLKANVNKNLLYEAAENDEVTTGDAYMYSTINGSKPQKYKIRIVEICSTDSDSNRNMAVKITDKRLLSKTNGIVQGMSGSPIVQNNKFAGALTHVFVDDCAMGYAVLAGNMINR